MDKYEMNLKFEQIKAFARTGDYESAAQIADEFDWSKIKQSKLLNLAASVYGANKEYDKEKEVLLVAYERAPMGRQLAYRLSIACLRLNEIEEAEEFYEDFVDMAPMDTARFILQYKIEKAKGADIRRQIEILEELFEEDMEEKWAYQLAALYAKDGQKDKCVAICDEIILWFQKGEYVKRAKELRRMFVPEEQEKKEAAATLEPYQEEAGSEEAESEEAAETGQPEKSEAEDNAAVLEAAAEEKSQTEIKEEKPEEQEVQAISAMPDTIKKFAQEKPLQEIRLSPELKLDVDGQISLDIEEENLVEKQITGQLSIDEILKQLESQGVLKPDTVNGAINVVKESTGVLPKLNLPPEEEMQEDKTQVKLDVDADGNLQLQEAEEAAVVEDEKDIYELGIQDLMSEEEKAKVQLAKKEAEQEEDVLKLVEQLENKEPETEKTTEDFDIPDTPDENERLTWEQRQVFKEYLGAPGLEYALAKALKNLVENYDKDGTSRKNNIIIMGEKKSGKTTIAMELIKMVNKERGRKGRKVAKVNGNIINKRGILTAMPRLIGSDLIIEDAGVINSKMMRQMLDTFKGYTDEMIVVLEDEKVTMEHMLNAYPFLDAMFENRIVIKEYDIHEWVAYAKAYAKESGYVVDDMGTLALYAKIDEAYGMKRGLEKSDVEDIIDEAIDRAERIGIGKIFSVFSKKSRGDMGVLKETDFQ